MCHSARVVRTVQRLKISRSSWSAHIWSKNTMNWIIGPQSKPLVSHQYIIISYKNYFFYLTISPGLKPVNDPLYIARDFRDNKFTKRFFLLWSDIWFWINFKNQFFFKVISKRFSIPFRMRQSRRKKSTISWINRKSTKTRWV